MARKKNPRVKALELLKDLKSWTEGARNHWTVASTVWEHGTMTRQIPAWHINPLLRGTPKGEELLEREYSNSSTRKRRPEEYPETSMDSWNQLFGQALEMERLARELKEHARTEWTKLAQALNRKEN